MRSAAGIRKSSNHTSFESDAPRPAFGISLTSTASISASNSVKNSVIPPSRSLSSRSDVRVRSMATSASWAFEVQIFWPLTTYSSPSRSANVSMREVSVPAFGSVTPVHTWTSPSAMRGR